MQDGVWRMAKEGRKQKEKSRTGGAESTEKNPSVASVSCSKLLILLFLAFPFSSLRRETRNKKDCSVWPGAVIGI
jgi:hypothetical protein